MWGKKENRFKKNNFWLWVTKGFYFQFIANGFWELKSKITPGFEQNHPKRNQQTTGEAWLSKCTFFLLKSGLGEKASFYNHKMLSSKKNPVQAFTPDSQILLPRGHQDGWEWRTLDFGAFWIQAVAPHEEFEILWNYLKKSFLPQISESWQILCDNAERAPFPSLKIPEIQLKFLSRVVLETPGAENHSCVQQGIIPVCPIPNPGMDSIPKPSSSAH